MTFQRRVEKTIQYASGIPIASSTIVVDAARRTLSQSAVQSTLRSAARGKPVSFEYFAAFVARHEHAERLRCLDARGLFEDNATLLDPRVVVDWNLDPPAASRLRRQRERESDDADVGGAGLRELHRLGHVFTVHETRPNGVVDAGLLQRRDRGAAVRRVLRVRDRDALHRRSRDALKPERRDV